MARARWSGAGWPLFTRSFASACWVSAETGICCISAGACAAFSRFSLMTSAGIARWGMAQGATTERTYASLGPVVSRKRWLRPLGERWVRSPEQRRASHWASSRWLSRRILGASARGRRLARTGAMGLCVSVEVLRVVDGVCFSDHRLGRFLTDDGGDARARSLGQRPRRGPEGVLHIVSANPRGRWPHGGLELHVEVGELSPHRATIVGMEHTEVSAARCLCGVLDIAVEAAIGTPDDDERRL